MMDKEVLEIAELTTVGFKPLILFKNWRVATLCYVDDLFPPEIATLERHMQTDEVFILMRGKVSLMLAGAGSAASKVEAVEMQPLKTYNVKLGAWHGVVMSKDAVILLVENVDTGAANSEYFALTPAMKQVYLAEARRFADWQKL